MELEKEMIKWLDMSIENCDLLGASLEKKALNSTKARLLSLIKEQPLFKVATEDSPEVLIEPERKYKGGGNAVGSSNQISREWAQWDKAPSISKTELELNQARVTISVKHKKLTEANKQLKEAKNLLITSKIYTDSTVMYDKIDGFLSKLNKD